tara:strand:+ start:341 stop:1360 length:1020 start_codon:yes stop_codon:yes gene_type:complete
MFKKNTFLITGGTGSFGKRFTEVLIKKYKPKKIIIFSRDELKQHEMQKKLTWNKKTEMRYFIGDVRDLSRLERAMKNVDIVIHAAALKHVPIAEYNPFEAIKTNVIGAQNVIQACLSSTVKKVVALSTDKAAAPINLYGATKLASDKLFISANNYKGSRDIKFSVVRYGNVMGSRGSVIPLFYETSKKNYIHITHKDMTRFNITLEEGIDLVIHSLKNMWGGELFVPKIPSFKIYDLAKAIAPKIKPKIVGIRPGEKIHEEMITETDSLNAAEFKNFFVILPDSKYIIWNRKKYLNKNKKDKGKMCKQNFSYNSKDNKKRLNISDLKKALQKNFTSDKN